MNFFQNNCECSQNPQKQWLFLGLSVVNFSTSLSFMKEGGSVSVTLVEDPYPTCPGGPPKYKLDNSLLTQEHTGPDPGWLGDDFELIGRPVVFKYDDFEFAGIVADHSYSDSPSGRTYKVEISSPYPLLERLNVITGEYTGNVDNVSNLLNAYGLFERDSCVTFGASRRTSSGMPWNNIRTAINLLTSVVDNTGPIVLGQYLQSNRLKFLTGLNTGLGLIPESDTGYMIDLSETPLSAESFRIDSISTTLTDILDAVANNESIEYFPELIPCKYDGVIYKIIKIRVINRNGFVDPNAIDNFIQNYNSECGVLSKTIKHELRSPPVSNFVVGPPKQHMYYGVQGVIPFTTEDRTFHFLGSDNIYSTRVYDLSSAIITPYYGKNTNGSAIIPQGLITVETLVNCNGMDSTWKYMQDEEDEETGKFILISSTCNSGCEPTMPVDNGDYADEETVTANCKQKRTLLAPQQFITFFNANTADLNQDLVILDVGNSMRLSDLDMISILIDKNEWKSSRYATDPGLSFLQGSFNNLNIASMYNLIDSDPSRFPGIKPLHFVNLRKLDVNSLTDTIEKDIDKIASFVENLATQYYGRKFMVRVPFLCVKLDEDTLEEVYSREIVDGGWPEENGVEASHVLGIPLYHPAMMFFKNSDGSIGAFVRFDNAAELDLSDLDPKDYGYSRLGNGSLWIKCSVEKDFVFGSYSNRVDPRIVIELPGPVKYRFNDIYMSKNAQGGWVSSTIFWPGAGNALDIYLKNTPVAFGQNLSGNKNPSEYIYAWPDAATIPLKNNQETYGPWIGLSTAVGVTEYINDPDLNPWTFGGVANMNTAGQTVASTGVTDMFKNVGGNITIPGSPVSRIGEELLSWDSTNYITGQRYLETRVGVTQTSITFPGVTYLYTPIINTIWSGSLGPIVSSISVSISDQGVTTSYDFNLYSKGFRPFPRINVAEEKKKVQRFNTIINRIKGQ